MATYFSPNGNPEVWDKKPDGYFTPEEWAAIQPPPLPPDPPTTEELQRQFDAAIEQRLSSFVQERGWSSVDRALNQHGAFVEDATIVRSAYDSTWKMAISLWPAVKNQTLTVEGALAQLPALGWG